MDVRTERPSRGCPRSDSGGRGKGSVKTKELFYPLGGQKARTGRRRGGEEDAKGRVTLFLRDPPLTAEDLRGTNQLGNFPSRTLHAVVHHRHVEFLLGGQLNLRGFQTASLFLLALGTAALQTRH